MLTNQGHYPFGEMWYQNGQGTKWMFTSYPRDNETGNDYANARYFLNRFGRFMTTDPADTVAQDATNPQSWDLYTYAANNPVNAADPTGLDCVYLTDDGNGVESIDHNSNTNECSSNGGYWQEGEDSGYTVVQNDNGDTAVIPIPTTTVTVTASEPWYDTLPEIGNGLLQTVSPVTSLAWNWLAAPRTPGCVAGATALGAAAGWKIGGGAGGVGGLGVGDEITVPAGIGIGFLAGGAAGWTAGMISCAKGREPKMGGNQRQNQSAADAAREAERQVGREMSDDQRTRFHDLISHQGYDYHEMVEIAKQILEGRA